MQSVTDTDVTETYAGFVGRSPCGNYGVKMEITIDSTCTSDVYRVYSTVFLQGKGVLSSYEEAPNFSAAEKMVKIREEIYRRKEWLITKLTAL